MIKEGMLAVFQDPMYKELYPDTRAKLEMAIFEFERLQANISNMIAKNNAERIRSQQSFWPGGRWLYREADKFGSCANN